MMDAKLKLLERFGYVANQSIKNYVKIHKLHGLDAWESFVPFRVAEQASEFDLYKLLKSNEKHAKEVLKWEMEGWK